MNPSERPFLDVSQSVTGQRWISRATPPQRAVAEAMVEQERLDPVLARVLAGRGVSVAEAESFLHPTLRDLLVDPSTLTDMDRAVARVAHAIEQGERIAIFGDYDVDGATSAALLKRFLAPFGLTIEIYIPDRVFEGYGPNAPAIRELVERGAKLIVTVDCGSTSHDALAAAAQAGVDVVVLDHHQTTDTLPEVAALVNPNRDDDLSGQGHLCAAGVVFVFLVALHRHLRENGTFTEDNPGPDLLGFLDLVALGTVCDVVPLVGVNRALVTRGLDVMQAQRNEGLAALAEAAGTNGRLAPWHLGFVLGPRINAGGRIGNAALGAELLTTDDPDKAASIAFRLDQLNGERQAMEQAMLKQAVDEADAEAGLGAGPGVIVTANDGWHAGVVGLLASRLKDRFRRPAFAIAFDDRDIGTGSARSIAGIDIGRAVREAVEQGLLERGGGHAMAAGITIKRDKLGAFRGWLEERFGETVREQVAASTCKIDAALSARGATPEFFDGLQQAGPFGSGNPTPVFAFPNHIVRYADTVGAGHVRFALRAPDGGEIRGISFRTADTPLGQSFLSRVGERLHVAGTLSVDNYGGQRRIQVRPVDVAVPDDG